MRNLAENWPRIPDWSTPAYERKGLTVTTVGGLTQHLVSGDLSAFGDSTGALGVVMTEQSAIRVARDRILLVNGGAALTSPGWHAEGFAATDVSGMYHVFDISGDGIPDLLREALTLDVANPGPSASVVFAGLPAVLYRYGGTETLRLHVERGFATHVISWLESRD